MNKNVRQTHIVLYTVNWLRTCTEWSNLNPKDNINIGNLKYEYWMIISYKFIKLGIVQQS